MPRKKIFAFNKIKRITVIDSMNNIVGSWMFLFLHIIWFWFWLYFDLGVGALTMVVSLEAIILMILLLMSQNKQSISDDIRDEADLQADLQSMETSEKTLRHIKEIKKYIKDKK